MPDINKEIGVACSRFEPIEIRTGTLSEIGSVREKLFLPSDYFFSVVLQSRTLRKVPKPSFHFSGGNVEQGIIRDGFGLSRDGNSRTRGSRWRTIDHEIDEPQGAV